MRTRRAVHAAYLQWRLNIIYRCIYHFQILRVCPLRLATFDIAIISLRALDLLIQGLLKVLYLEIIRERRALARLNQRPLLALNLLLLLELLDLLRQVYLMVEQVYLRDTVAI